MSLYEELINRMRHMDWFYEYSDDQAAWRKGRAALNELVDDLLRLPEAEAKSLWSQYAPKELPPHLNLTALTSKRKLGL